MNTNSPWYSDQRDPQLHNDEPYKPSGLAQAVGAAFIGIVIILALYGGAQIVAGIVAGAS